MWVELILKWGRSMDMVRDTTWQKGEYFLAKSQHNTWNYPKASGIRITPLAYSKPGTNGNAQLFSTDSDHGSLVQAWTMHCGNLII